MTRATAHEVGSCDASTRTRRLVSCNRCRRPNLVWHSCNRTGGKDTGHALYEPLPTHVSRAPKADTTKPHVCTGRWSADSTPRPQAPVGTLTEDRVRELIAEAMQNAPDAGGSGIDENRVKDIVAEATVGVIKFLGDKLDALQLPARVTTIEMVKEGKPVAKVDRAHKQLPELMYWAQTRDVQGHRWPIMLFGKPGVAKSHSAHQVADALKLSFGLITLNMQTPESRLFGFPSANGVYQRTAFREAFEHGGVFCIDEMDNASGGLLTSLNTCLANGIGAFPDGMVKRHPDFICIATANTPGRGGDRNHAERRQLDAATINRFIVIEWELDDDLELSLMQQVNPKADAWLGWIRTVRAYCAQHHPTVIVSPRSTFAGARGIIDAPFPLAKLADMVLFKGLDKDTKAKILAACPLPVVTEVAK